MKSLLLKLLPHAVAVLVFVVVSCAFFSKLFNGYELRQGDIDNHTGMSKEISDFRLANDGEEPLWTNSMFGGMPAYQISVKHHSNVMLHIDTLLKLGLPYPVGVLFMAMLGFYILCLCLRVNPWVGIVGGIGFGLASINILYLGAGHNSKVNAIAYMAPALGGMLLALRGKMLAGAAVFCFFLSLQISANHLQMTYYLMIMMGLIALAELVHAIIQKRVLQISKASAMLAIAGVIAVLPTASNLITTQEYGQYTTRGKSELTTKPDGSSIEAAQQNGLNPSYILEYNFGRGEWSSVFIPNAKGGHATARLGDDKKAMAKATEEMRAGVTGPDSFWANNTSEEKGQIMQSAVTNLASMSRYWGGQSFTAGAFYFGAVIMFLFVMALFFTKDILRWPSLLLTLLALALCSNNPGGINDFFINHFPLYNKFRDSKMILVMVQIIAPMLVVLFLHRLISNVPITTKKKWYLAVSGGVMMVLLLVMAAPNSFSSFQSAEETVQFDGLLSDSKQGADQIEFVQLMLNGMTTARISIFTGDVQRTFLFVLVAAVLVMLALMRKLPGVALIPILAILIMADQFAVDRRYLNEDKVRNTYRHYLKPDEKFLPFDPMPADNFILQLEKAGVENFDATKSKLLAGMKRGVFKNVRNTELMGSVAEFGALGLNSNYRVLKLTGLTQDARTAYFHKSLGGYHGAKLKRYNEVIEWHLSEEMQSFAKNANTMGPVAAMELMPVVNMLNTKYIIHSDSLAPLMNYSVCGNAWFVGEVATAKTADEEIKALKNFNPKTTCVVQQTDAAKLTAPASIDSTWTVTLDEYHTNYLKYSSNSTMAAPVVFSEIYYPAGWLCTVDGKPQEYVCANYILRAVQVPAGEHTIEWKFEPESFATGKNLSYAGSAILLLFTLGVAGMETRKALRNSRNEIRS